jgi:hypothetical protein
MPRFGSAFAFGNDAMFRTNGKAVFGDHNRGSMLAEVLFILRRTVQSE